MRLSNIGTGTNEYLFPPGPNPDVNPNPDKPDPTPASTPDACDPTLVLDAVTTLRGEKMFFKGRYSKSCSLDQMFSDLW